MHEIWYVPFYSFKILISIRLVFWGPHFTEQNFQKSWNTSAKYDPFSNVTNSPKKYFPLEVKMAINVYILYNTIMCVCVCVFSYQILHHEVVQKIMYVLPLMVKTLI